MPFFTNLLILIVVIWLFAGLLLLLHRFSDRIGLLPLIAVLGGLGIAFQLRMLEPSSPNTSGLNVTIGANLIPAVLLLGLLIIYIVHGATQARSAFAGVILTALVFELSQLLPQPAPGMVGLPVGSMSSIPATRIMASIIALTLDFIVLVITYQLVSNLRRRYPSRLACSLAILVALCVDSLVFSTILHFGQPAWAGELKSSLVTHILAAVALWPILFFYVPNAARVLPDSTASIQRPALDIFTTIMQLEARDRRHFSLYQMLTLVNQMILRSEEPDQLLHQVCEILVEYRNYHMVWVGLFDPEDASLKTAVRAAQDPRWLDQFPLDMGQGAPDSSAQAVLSTQELSLYADLGQFLEASPWRQDALSCGLKACAAIPMRHAGRASGVLMVFATRPEALNSAEMVILQELADNLAHAVASIDTHRQQAVLKAGVDHMQDGLLITDTDGQILYVNAAASDLVRRPVAELKDQFIRDLVSPEQKPLIHTYIQAVLQSGHFSAEFNDVLPDDHKIYLSVRVDLVGDEQGGPQHILIGLQDTSRWRLYEEQLQSLNHVITDSVQMRDLDELLPKLLPTTEKLLQAWASAVYLLGLEDHNIVQYHAHNLSDAYAQRIARGFSGLPGDTALRTQQPVFVQDVLNDLVYQERIHFMADFGIRALTVQPIVFRGQVMGAIVAYYNHPHVFLPEEVQLGATLSYALAIVIQNTRLYQAERGQRQFAETLVQAAASLNRSLNLDDVLDEILAQTIQLTSCKAVNIMLIENGLAYIVRSRGYNEEITQDKFYRAGLPITVPTLYEMMNGGQPLLIADTLNSTHWAPQEGLQWIRSYVGAPLRIGDEVVGFLNADSDQADFFTHETAIRLQALAAHAAIAIQNASLYEDSHKRTDELAALVQAAAAVSTSLDTNQVLDMIAHQMTRLVNVDGCYIADYDPVKEQLRWMAFYDASQRLTVGLNWFEALELASFPQTYQVVQTGRSNQFHAAQPELSAAERTFIEKSGSACQLVVPLIIQDRVTGLAGLLSVDAKRTFNVREIELVQALGSHAAIAIQNARTFQSTREYANILEERVQERTLELQTAKERIEGILASVPDAVFVLDEEAQPLHANQAGEALLTQAVYQGLELFPRTLIQALKDGNLPSEKAILQIADRAYQALASPLSFGQYARSLIVVFRDVTRFQELDRLKTKFVSDVSHELRTPLSNMTIYLDLLAASSDSERRDTYMQTLQRETRRLTHLIEDLLTISRLEAGRLQVEPRFIQVNQLITDLTNDRMIMAAQQGLNLNCTIAPDLPFAVADYHLLNQCISNLLTNAILYTPAGGTVSLQTSLYRDHDCNWITIAIQDTGVGIPANELPFVFERFFRGSAGVHTGSPGTGLGLSISKEIIERMNGRITVESTQGRGSSFTIWIPALEENSYSENPPIGV